MKNIIQSFSYGLQDVNVVALAEDKAKSEGISFSKYLLDLIKADIKKKPPKKSLS